jgi:hypothetical protein
MDRGVLFARNRLAWRATPKAEPERAGYQQGVRAMKYFIGFIVGVVLTIAGAYLYDHSGSVANPLVNWTAANALVQTAVDDVKVQFDRLVKQLGG